MAEQPALLLVRFRAGVVGETSRVCHIVAAPSGDTMPEILTAYCSTEIGPGQAEWLQKLTGMPCTLCLVRMPRAGAELPPGGHVEP